MKTQQGISSDYIVGDILYIEYIDTHPFFLDNRAISPVISIKLYRSHFPDETDSYIGNDDPIQLYLNQADFKKFTGRDWDGTKEGIKKHKDIKGKPTKLNLMVNTN